MRHARSTDKPMDKRTREYSAWWEKDQARKQKEYDAMMAPVREKMRQKFEQERITIGMLLDAEWSEGGKYFERLEKDLTMSYFDFRGEPLDPEDRWAQLYRRMY